MQRQSQERKPYNPEEWTSSHVIQWLDKLTWPDGYNLDELKRILVKNAINGYVLKKLVDKNLGKPVALQKLAELGIGSVSANRILINFNNVLSLREFLPYANVSPGLEESLGVHYLCAYDLGGSRKQRHEQVQNTSYHLFNLAMLLLNEGCAYGDLTLLREFMPPNSPQAEQLERAIEKNRTLATPLNASDYLASLREEDLEVILSYIQDIQRTKAKNNENIAGSNKGDREEIAIRQLRSIKLREYYKNIPADESKIDNSKNRLHALAALWVALDHYPASIIVEFSKISSKNSVAMTHLKARVKFFQGCYFESDAVLAEILSAYISMNYEKRFKSFEDVEFLSSKQESAFDSSSFEDLRDAKPISLNQFLQSIPQEIKRIQHEITSTGDKSMLDSLKENSFNSVKPHAFFNSGRAPASEAKTKETDSTQSAASSVAQTPSWLDRLMPLLPTSKKKSQVVSPLPSKTEPKIKPEMKPLMQWTEDDVVSWIGSLRLGNLADVAAIQKAFKKYGCTGRDLPELEDSIMQHDLCIDSKVVRIRIRSYINKEIARQDKIKEMEPLFNKRISGNFTLTQQHKDYYGAWSVERVATWVKSLPLPDDFDGEELAHKFQIHQPAINGIVLLGVDSLILKEHLDIESDIICWIIEGAINQLRKQFTLSLPSEAKSAPAKSLAMFPTLPKPVDSDHSTLPGSDLATLSKKTVGF